MSPFVTYVILHPVLFCRVFTFFFTYWTHDVEHRKSFACQVSFYIFPFASFFLLLLLQQPFLDFFFCGLSYGGTDKISLFCIYLLRTACGRERVIGEKRTFEVEG